MDTDQWLGIGAICTVFVCCVFSIGAGYRYMQAPSVQYEDLLSDSIPSSR